MVTRCVVLVMPAAVLRRRVAHSYGGTATIWKHPTHHHQPSEPAALCLLKASKAVGSLGWLSLRSYNYVIVIDHFLACMHIRRVYKKYTRVGDFDTPTHQPTNIASAYKYICIRIHKVGSSFFKQVSSVCKCCAGIQEASCCMPGWDEYNFNCVATNMTST